MKTEAEVREALEVLQRAVDLMEEPTVEAMMVVQLIGLLFWQLCDPLFGKPFESLLNNCAVLCAITIGQPRRGATDEKSDHYGR